MKTKYEEVKELHESAQRTLREFYKLDYIKTL